MKEFYKSFLPDSPEEFKVTYDEKLGLIAEEVWNKVEAEGKIEPYRFIGDRPWKRHFGEQFVHKLQDFVSEDTHNFILQELFGYLGFEKGKMYPSHINLDIMEDCGDAADLRFTVSRVPNISYGSVLKQLSPDTEHWPSATWHMDFGHDLDTYKFIIYVNDVEPDSGGILFSDPLITPHLPDGTPTWEYEGGSPKLEDGYATNVKLNVEEVSINDIKVKEITGKKGTVVCFNSHIAHTANPPRVGFRKALHLVLKHIPAKPYVYGHMNTLRTLDTT